ncbi:MAG: V-type ATP synthase subunit D [Pseudomonadota bacterium]
MARLSLSKAQMAREKTDLAAYRRFLPSLDLKRKQLMAERARVAEALAQTEAEIAGTIARIGAQIPMLAEGDLGLDGLVTLKAVRLGERNVVGQRLPVLETAETEILPYGRMTRPHWVDLTASRLEEVVRLRVEAQVAARALDLLDAAIVKVTQRVNLFDKVLIPRARANIKRIGIALGDLERAAVVNSKIAKRKREAVDA